MKPRICYKHKCSNTSRYVLLYPDGEGYKNWMWTNFDSSLQESIEGIFNGFTVVSHINQPVQSNGKSFTKNIKSVFNDKEHFEKILDKNKRKSLISKLSSILSPVSDSSLLHIAFLNENNRDSFFSFRDLGCFWYIFILRNEDFLENFISSLNRESINEDDFFSGNKELPCVFYRDYLKNSISILSNEDAVSSHIEKYINNEKIPIFNKAINNIFDNNYIDEIYYNDIRE